MQTFLQHFVEIIQKFGIIGLSTLSFTESSFFPIPPDIVLLPMMFLNPKLSFFYALITTITSVLGGIFGHFIGRKLGRPILNKFFNKDKISKVETYFRNYGGWAVAIAGFTPIPYKIFTISAGVFSIPISIFIIASILGRGMRFFLEAFIVYFYGETAKYLLTNYFELITIGLTILIFILVLIYRYLSKIEYLKVVGNKLRINYFELYQLFLKYKTLDKITFYYISGILLSLFFLMIIFELIEDYSFNVFFRLDNYFFTFILKLRTPFSTATMKIITATGNYYFVILITIIIVAVLFLKNERKLSIYFGMNIFIVWIFNEVLKQIFHRQRPDFSRMITQTGYSFPSGHAMIFLTLSIIFILLINTKLNYKYKKIINILIIFYSLAVGMSRVYLGVHYFSDVFSGWLVAIIFSLTAVLVYNNIIHKL